MTLDALRVDNRDQAYLAHSRRAGRKDFVETLRRDLADVVAIPARRIAQQKIDALPGPRGLLGERVCQVADFAVGCHERVTIRAAGVVSRRAVKGEKSEDAEHDHAKTQTPEPDCPGLG